MRRLVMMTTVVLAMLPVMVAAQTPSASPVASPSPVACDDWYAYRLDMIGAWRTMSGDAYASIANLFGVPFDDYATVPTPYLRDAAQELDSYALAIAGVDDPPEALQPLHDAYLGRVVLVAHYARANADGDVWGIAFYSDRIQRNQAEIRAHVDVLSSACPSAWTRLTDARSSPFPLMWDGWASPEASG